MAAILELNYWAVLRSLGRIEEASLDIRDPLKRFAQYMRVQVDSMFQRNRLGGRHRGVTWRYFALQYKRKTDGVRVPAAGGVPKLRGGGLVKGRMRPSGRRVQKGSSILQDTGTTRARAALVVMLRRDRVQLAPQGVRYAARQQAMRPFLFFYSPDDNRELLSLVLKHLRKAADGE